MAWHQITNDDISTNLLYLRFKFTELKLFRQIIIRLISNVINYKKVFDFMVKNIVFNFIILLFAFHY